MPVLTLEDAKAYLNIEVDKYDAVLQATIDAAVATIENWVGPLEETDLTARIFVTGDVIVFPFSPLVSVTSVGPVGWDALPIEDLTLNLPAGLGARTDGAAFMTGMYDVSYRAGWTTLPADLLLAVKELVRHLFGPQRGSGSRPGPAPDAVTPGYLLPNMVRSLIEPYRAPRVS